MNQQIETANKFIDVMCESEGRLNQVKEKIDNRKSDIQDIMKKFSIEQKNIIENVKNTINSEGSKKIFEEYNNVLMATINKNEEKYIEYIKGTEFINKFEETFIVSVFGKVKSGKSYLGNYVMGNSFKKNNIKTNYDKLGDIKVSVYDRGKLSATNFLSENIDESKGQGFGVASTEATSTIQYFKIGGLTWFDTPGIGSITKENEELAEEYIKNSDLVVFSMNSDAAGTQQEIRELKSLYEMNKPMLLLITQSDTSDFVFDENNEPISIPVPKSDKDRKDVEKYIIDTIIENGLNKALELSNGKVLTISTKLAVNALEKDDYNAKLYEGSNMDFFMKRLMEITEGDAAQLKERNPKDRFNKFIIELLESINEFDNEVKKINEDAKLIIENAKAIKKNVIANVRYHSLGIIHDNVIKATMESKNSNGVKTSGKKIASDVSSEINKIINSECLKAMKELIPDISSKLKGNLMNSDSIDIADLGDKKVMGSYQVTVEKRKKVSRGAFGKILDFVCGEKYTTVSGTETKTFEFTVGNNSMEIEEQLINYFENICNTTLDDMIKDIIEGCVKPFEIIYTGFVDLTNNTRKELENLKIK